MDEPRLEHSRLPTLEESLSHGPRWDLVVEMQQARSAGRFDNLQEPGAGSNSTTSNPPLPDDSTVEPIRR